MNPRFALFFLCLTTGTAAASLPPFPSEQNDSLHSLFIYTEPNSQAFDIPIQLEDAGFNI
ncbi:hypothetical protein ACXHQN_10920 [Vibrio cincinnatiensis]